MIRYKLSRKVNIIDTADYKGAEIPGHYREKYYILHDEGRDKDFLINQTVRYFIDKFTEPKSQSDVLEEISAEVEAGVEIIQKKCSSFFNFLCRRRILVPESVAESAISTEPLYKPGDYIGDMRVLEVISNKRYIDLYLAINEIDGSSWVIKLLNHCKTVHKKNYAEELTDLEREYKMLKSIRHLPFLNHAHRFYKGRGEIAYIQLEHIKGKTLARWLHDTENMNMSTANDIIRNILEAFSSLHKSKLIHGDIHPSNILVCEDNSIKIIDLGLSVRAGTQKDEVVAIGGVNYYMPPERINSKSISKFSKPPDFYSDVYQVGLIMYFVLYRKEPFSGFTWEELAKNIKKCSAEFCHVAFSGYSVPGFLVRIIKKCLHKKPMMRYTDAGDVLKDFTIEETVSNY